MKKRILTIALSLLMILGCTGCSVFDDMADQLFGTQETPEPIVISSYFDPVKAQEEADAAEKAARELKSPDTLRATLAESIVKINAYNRSDELLSTCAGFYAYGCVFTSMDSILGADHADIVLYDGGVYTVTGVRYYNADMNVAVLSSTRQNTPDLTAGKWGIEMNEAAYALGPDSALSEGSVIATGVSVNAFDCVQTSAAITSSTAGGPLVNGYGELLGLCVMDAAGDGQNYAISTGSMESMAQGSTISMDEFRAANNIAPEGTRVVTGDAGEKLYDTADYIELESNDTTAEATELHAGMKTAAYINREGNGEGDTADSVDIFSFTVEEKSNVEILICPHYKDDAQYIDGTWVTNADLEHLKDSNGYDTGYITAYDSDGKSYQRGQCEVEAGTYYIVVKLTSGWSHDTGAYYTISYNVN